MKIARYNIQTEPVTLARTGVLLGEEMIGDLRAGYAAYLAETASDPQAREIAAMRIPPNVAEMLALGGLAHDAITVTTSWLLRLLKENPSAKGLAGEPLFSPLANSRFHAPVRPNKFIAASQNYHGPVKQRVHEKGRVPSCWIKTGNTIIGPHRDVVKPVAVKQLDCETELVIVINKRCKNVPEDRAYDVIFGYLVANDFSARDVGNIEHAAGGGRLLAKMFDTFCPMGPWIVTKEEIPDPMNLKIRTTVNGELRQAGCSRDMIWNIPQLVAYASQMTLEPGDLIMTGTPIAESGGKGRFLTSGDVVESEIEGIGCLRNKVIDDVAKEASWQW